jgi:hypothetical protein
MLLIVELIQQLIMHNEHNQPIEIVPTDRIYPELHHIKHLDSNHSIETIVIIVTLLNSIKNLLKSLDKLRKSGKLDSKLLLQIVGAILAIWEAIAQMNNQE